ncbi:MAG TPA: hypothetical protein ENK66_05990 [Arcobacter sp.]|nr:hypothetical protein [Arcobacter sp.]
MQHLIANLSNAINTDLHIPITSKEIRINETKNDSGCKKVILKSTSKNIFAFSLDYQLKNKCKMFPFLNQSLGDITKINDAIIFYKNGNDIFVLLIELKSKDLGDYTKQLQAGKNWVLYLTSMLNLTFNKNYQIDNNNIRSIVFSTRKTQRKKGTKRENIKFDKINDLLISEQQCNETFYIEKFLK